MEDKKRDYINKNISKNLINVLLYLKLISTKIKCNHGEFGIIGTPHSLINDLENGKIPLKKEKELNKNEY